MEQAMCRAPEIFAPKNEGALICPPFQWTTSTGKIANDSLVMGLKILHQYFCYLQFEKINCVNFLDAKTECP